MKFIIKLISAIVIVLTLYVLGVFLMPSQTDDLGKMIGTYGFNQSLRALKSGSDDIGEQMLQIKQAEETINQVRQVRDTVNTKIDQANKVVDSVNKVTDSISEVQKNVNDLTEFSGSSASGSTKTTIRR